MSDSLERYGIKIDIDTQDAKAHIESLKTELSNLNNKKVTISPTIDNKAVNDVAKQISEALANKKKFVKAISIDEIKISEQAAKGIVSQINGALSSAVKKFSVESLPAIKDDFAYIKQVSEGLSGAVDATSKSLKDANNTISTLSKTVGKMQSYVDGAAKAVEKAAKPPVDRSKLGNATRYYDASKEAVRNDKAMQSLLRGTMKNTPLDIKTISSSLFGGAIGAVMGGVLKKNEDNSLSVYKKNGALVADIVDANGKLTAAGENVVKTIQSVAQSLNVSLTSAIKNIAALAGIDTTKKAPVSTAPAKVKTIYSKTFSPKKEKQAQAPAPVQVVKEEKDASDADLLAHFKGKMMSIVPVPILAAIAAKALSKMSSSSGVSKALSAGGAGSGGFTMQRLVAPKLTPNFAASMPSNFSSVIGSAVAFAIPVMIGKAMKSNTISRQISAIGAGPLPESLAKNLTGNKGARLQNHYDKLDEEWNSLAPSRKAAANARRKEIRAEQADMEAPLAEANAEAAKLAENISAAFTFASGVAKVFETVVQIVDAVASAILRFGDGLKQAAANVANVEDAIGNKLNSIWSKVKQIAGISSQGLFRGALTEVKKIDTEFQKTINTLKAMIGTLLQPLSSALITILQQIMIYINAFVKALTGKDLLKTALKNAKRIEGHAANTRKKLSLASFDTILNIGKSSASGGGGGGTFAGYLDESDWPQVSERILDFVTKLGEALAPVYDLFKDLFAGLDEWGNEDMGVIVVMKELVGLFNDFQLVMVAAKVLSGDFGGALTSLALVLGSSFLGAAMDDYITSGGEMNKTTKQVQEFVDDLSDKIKDLKDWFAKLKNGVLEFVDSFDILPVIKGVATLAENVGALGQDAIIAKSCTGDFTAVLKTPFYSALETVGKSLNKVVNNLGQYDKNGDGALSTSELMNAVWENMSGILDGIWKLIGDVAVGVVSGVKRTVNAVANMVKGFLSAAFIIAPVAGLVLIASGNIPMGVGLLASGIGAAALGVKFNNTLQSVNAALDSIGNGAAAFFGSTYSGGAGTSVSVSGSDGVQVDPNVVARNDRIAAGIESIVNNGIGLNKDAVNSLNLGLNKLEPPTAKEIAAENGAKFSSALQHTKLKASSVLKTEVKLNNLIIDKGNGHMNFNYTYAAKGTNFVPEDQFAQIHKGEAIIPRAFNTSEFFKKMGGSQEVADELKAIRKDINNMKLSIKLDGKEIADNTVRHINEETRLQGRSVLV